MTVARLIEFLCSIDKTLSLQPFADIFVLSDFSGHRVKWLTHSNITKLGGNRTLSFSITQFLHINRRLPPRMSPSNSDGHSSLLDLFLTSSHDSFSSPQLYLLGNILSVMSALIGIRFVISFAMFLGRIFLIISNVPLRSLPG